MKRFFLGIDVGTGSARAGVFDRLGRMVAAAAHDIQLWEDGANRAEQSSTDIQRAVCGSVRAVLATAGLGSGDIAGVGFDATCSLVVLGKGGAPLPVGAHGDADRNVIVWKDHRATSQARRINETGHRVLDYVGGAISPEMETPKLLWLKENLPSTYLDAWQFLDLTDFLSWWTTGSLARSVCTVTCKWTYLAHEGRWDASYFRQIGLGDLADEGFVRIGTQIVAAGDPLGAGLTKEAAAELGLEPGTPVGAGLIDAHAGGMGSVGAGGRAAATSRMAYVFGTSACTMSSSAEPIFIPGVWGPYHSAMIPGLWLSEGGQSGAGAAIDQLVLLHPAAPKAIERAAAAGMGLPAWLSREARERCSSTSDAALLAGSLVVVPEFLGNRSPHADPEARALIAGLGTERDLSHLVALYVAGILGIGYGLRQIIEASRSKQATINTLALSGGAGRDPLVRQLLADCTGVPVQVPRETEAVLLGAAMLGARASGAFPSVIDAMEAMSAVGGEFVPTGGEMARFHARRFDAFETLQTAGRSIRALIEGES